MSEQAENKKAGFSTRLGLLMVMLGASCGAGNIWRFPRIAAINGGGSFIIAWSVALFVVGIPIIIAEMMMGRATRHGCPGAFRDFIGEKYSWMGTVLCITTVGLTSYYTVVIAWVSQYLVQGITGQSFGADKEIMFNGIANGNVVTWIIFALTISVAAYTVMRGTHFMEKIDMILIPFLFLILVILAIKAVMLPGALKGIEYYFSISKEELLSPQVWLQAITQVAWSVGPGQGLLLTLAVYTKSKSDISLNVVFQGTGDNAISLIAGFAVLPAVFALVPYDEAMGMVASGNQGFTFIALANLFEVMPGGYVVAILFWISLIVAVFASLISVFQVGVAPLVDIGWSRKKSCVAILIVCLIWGTPSALSQSFFNNQDWMIGMVLLLGALFTCYAVVKFGVEKARTQYINIPENDFYVGRWWNVCIKFIGPGLIIIMFIWWTIQAISWYPETWWNPFLEDSLGTAIVQGALIVLISLIFNKKIAKSSGPKYFKDDGYPDVPEEHLQ